MMDEVTPSFILSIVFGFLATAVDLVTICSTETETKTDNEETRKTKTSKSDEFDYWQQAINQN